MQTASMLREYLLGQRLGATSKAEVWSASNVMRHGQFAVKVMAKDALSGASRREGARAQAALAHRGIVPIRDLFLEDGAFCVVMPLYARGSLGKRLKSGGAMPLQEALQVAADVLSALDYAHRRGIVHGDIKPSNVLFDDADWPLLSDFGMAEDGPAWAGERTPAPLDKGPEGARADVGADVFGAGCLLYEMISGYPPFPKGLREAALTSREGAGELQPLPLDVLRRDVPQRLSAVVLRALSHDPGTRFSTCAELATCLDILRVGMTLGNSLPAPKLPDLKTAGARPQAADEQGAPAIGRYESAGPATNPLSPAEVGGAAEPLRDLRAEARGIAAGPDRQPGLAPDCGRGTEGEEKPGAAGCPRCGKPLGAGAHFCRYCGSKTGFDVSLRTSPDFSGFCVQCGKPVKSERTSCGHCGSSSSRGGAGYELSELPV